MKFYTAAHGGPDRSEAELLAPARLLFYLGSMTVWAFLGLVFGAWHPRWLAVAMLVSALALFAWKKWGRDLLSMVVLLIGVALTLFLGDSTLSLGIGVGCALVALATLSEALVRWVRTLLS